EVAPAGLQLRSAFLHPEGGLEMRRAKQIGLTVALVAGGLALSLGSAFAGCTSAAIGPASGNPEKDTIGCAGQDLETTGAVGGAAMVGQRSVVQVGGATGS